ncbi:MAG: right-handed parallel beta-helix repeat-containing protein [Verrucomicrobia bacterium]|nr:right-handed parallel beta-helix repeat-containing protein [Verrucomicrobiota bacterium]MDE3099008.1 right-handed parallel beta-helix repeat-containing protein [Verrucomicrobiota bacterium]
MTSSHNQSLSRRRWLGLASTSTLAAGAGLLAGRAVADGPIPSDASDGHLSGAKVYNIRDFGAVGDRKTLDTAAVQAAVDACFKDGGGTVLVPAGVFQIGMIELKSNVTLRISAGGTLLGTGDGRQYHNVAAVPLRGDATAGDGDVGLIYAVHSENVTVEGPGTIDGQGTLFQHRRGDPNPSAAGIGGSHRPYHLMFYQCRNVRVRNIYLKDCAFHSMRIFRCSFCWFDGIHLWSRVNGNNDGFHFISSEYVHVSNCDIQCQDDACALFGSCKFVTVTNSSFSTRWSVFRFGGGTADNITVSNCIMDTVFGCPIKIAGGPRSHFQNMMFSNLVMNNVTGPISISMGAWRGRRRRPGMFGVRTNGMAGAERAVTGIETNMASDMIANSEGDSAEKFEAVPAPGELPEVEGPGYVRDIVFSNIRATVVKPFPLPGTKWPSGYNRGEVFSCIGLNAIGENFIEKIVFDNVHITFPGGGTAEQAAVRDVPKVVGEYYAVGVFPSYGLYARQVRGLTLNNVRFDLAAPDLRPAVVFDHVQDAAVSGLNVQGVKNAESALRFIDSKDVLLSAPRLIAPAPVFLQVEGADNGNIIVDGGDLTKAARPLAFKNGGAENSVKLRG